MVTNLHVVRAVSWECSNGGNRCHSSHGVGLGGVARGDVLTPRLHTGYTGCKTVVFDIFTIDDPVPHAFHFLFNTFTIDDLYHMHLYSLSISKNIPHHCLCSVSIPHPPMESCTSHIERGADKDLR